MNLIGSSEGTVRRCGPTLAPGPITCIRTGSTSSFVHATCGPLSAPGSFSHPCPSGPSGVHIAALVSVANAVTPNGKIAIEASTATAIRTLNVVTPPRKHGSDFANPSCGLDACQPNVSARTEDHASWLGAERARTDGAASMRNSIEPDYSVMLLAEQYPNPVIYSGDRESRWPRSQAPIWRASIPSTSTGITARPPHGARPRRTASARKERPRRCGRVVVQQSNPSSGSGGYEAAEHHARFASLFMAPEPKNASSAMPVAHR